MSEGTSDYIQEAQQLVSELIDAAHGTVLNEDQAREDEARASLLAHIERGCYPQAEIMDNNERVPDGWSPDVIDVIAMLLRVAEAAFLALDDSEEFEGEDGLAHAISSANFDELSSALDALDGLPDDKPGEHLNPAGKALWVLQHIFSRNPDNAMAEARSQGED